MRSEIIVKDANRIFGSDIMSNTRQRVNVDARAAVIHYLRSHYGVTYQKIADMFSRTHSSVMHGKLLHEDLYRFNADYRTKYDQLSDTYALSKLFCNPCVFQLIKN